MLDNINISIHSLTNKLIANLKFKSDSLVEDIKLEIEKNTKIPWFNHILINNERLLHCTKTLEE